MSRFTIVFMLTMTVVMAAHPTLAASYAVGTCKPTLPSFASISVAVSSVPPSSSVLVCPGTYKEQVTISQPLTLQGITSANSAQAVIAVPDGGLSTVPDVYFGPVAFQVMVTAGSVTVTNITVDGTGGGGNGCFNFVLVGIYYSSGSSGTVSEVTTRNQINNQCSVGIVAENFSSTSESVTIQNSSVHDVDGVGIEAVTDQTQPTLTATIKGNTVDVDGGDQGIQAVFNAGSVTGNFVSGGVEGLLLAAPASIASGNTITKSYFGIFADIDGVSATSNKISNSVIGIVTTANGTTFQSNTITRTTTGIDFRCHTATVAHNTINDATVGLTSVPASFASPNTFFNVSTIRTGGC